MAYKIPTVKLDGTIDGRKAPEFAERNKPVLVANAFRKGVSPNPGGLSKEALLLRQLAMPHVQEAIDCVVSLIRSGQPDEVRLKAAHELFNRVYGRPKETVESLNVNVDGGKVVYRVVLGEAQEEA